MIGYFDTSAVVPLVIDEMSSGLCSDFWDMCETRVSSMLVIPEAHAALAQALRLNRMTFHQYEAAVELLNSRISLLKLIVPFRTIADSAAKLAQPHSLRGYDAVHVATALALQAPELVVISGDSQVLDACTALGIYTMDTNTEYR